MGDVQHGIITEIAAKQGPDPTKRAIEQYESVNSEAVERLVTGSDSEVRVRVISEDYSVHIEPDGSVSVAIAADTSVT